MVLKSFLTKLFFKGEILEKVYSCINGEILVVEKSGGKREMKIGGITQSGGLVEKLWREIFSKKLGIFRERQVSECLILGLGAGTLPTLIASFSPATKMTAVEIDPVVLRVGKKYFALDKIPNLKIINSDAFKALVSPKIKKTRFDLIVVDLYLGQQLPQEVESKEFLINLKRILQKKGIIIFNRLYYNPQLKKEAHQFIEKLVSFFPNVKTKKILTNLLILASF